MIIVIGYLIFTAIFGFTVTVILGSTGGSFDVFFDPKQQKRFCFKKKERIITCLINYILMLPWAIGYWVYRLIKRIRKRR